MDPDTNDIISFQELSLDKENELEELEEEDELEEYVTVGFLEKPKHPKFLLRHRFPSKTGGAPIYAPISDKESTFHRMLYVFLCPSMICLLQNQYEQWKHREEDPRRSVKVFRCQLPRFNAFYSSEPPRRDGNDKPLIVGAALCSWCGTWKGEKVCSSCKRAPYCSKKHQARHWKSGHKIQCHQIIGSEDISCETSSLVPKHVTDDTYQFLLDKFEADDNKKSWASFQERISKCPSQVLRYSRDLMVNPLWPLSIGRPSLVNIPKCKYCNGSLCYEFQIMPQLLYYLGVKNDSDSLDWGVIVIYTCLASCESNVRYKEEFTWVQLYPTAPVT
ncbi:hypothetical protein ZIOFF_067738 [Zingiber officinale]|uniref:MYND-type domain-containing protein n=1 Tax=Zingiber officinale TaxID=94328 RepID=A0A8J5CBN5_ZINOF|nr:hypothetical protein ZIOFF_067738 [Zingiber officinale]